jgi:hypothetical protein
MRSSSEAMELSSGIIMDMRLVQEFCRSSQKTSQTISQVNNLSSLINLLRHKNSQYSYSDEHRYQNQVWALNKKGDTQALVERVRVIKEEHEKMQ